MSNSTSQLLPVDSKQISSKSHVVLRLDQLQRAILDDPGRYDQLEDDRSLNHVRKEVRLLQDALMKAIQDDVEAQKQQLLRAAELMATWQGETELKDILMLDGHRRTGLFEQASRCESYQQWVNLAEQLREEFARLFNKYRGYFAGQQNDFENKKIDTHKKLKPIPAKMDEWRVKREILQQHQMTVNFYYQQSTHYLVIGMGALAGMMIAGHFLGNALGWLWPGWFWGLLAGYSVFSFLASRFAYVSGKPMQDLYDFLLERYPLKNVKPFFRYEDSENPQQPTRFDATRGDILSQILQKDILAASSEFTLLERQRDEHLGYVQYLEGRKQWAQAQIERMDTLQPQEQPEVSTMPEIRPLVVESKDSELSKIPAPEEETLERIPDPPVIALPVEIPQIERKAVAGRKVRPAKMSDNALPDRAS